MNVVLTGSSTGIGRALACGAVTGAAGGLLVPLLGGHLLGGNLDLLERQFTASHIRLDAIAHLFGESGFFGHGPIMHKKVYEVPFVEGKLR